MGKVWIEVSLISARGLRRSSLWKLQWFAVGWIDPKNKYCTKMDGSGNSHSIWKTKFATLIDSSGSGLPGLSLHVEVYSREPVFLRETLLGTASVPLKEFLSKHSRNDRKGKAAIEEVGSYQLRKGNSGKTLGFIDVAVHISEEGDVHSTYSSGRFRFCSRVSGTLYRNFVCKCFFRGILKLKRVNIYIHTFLSIKNYTGTFYLQTIDTLYRPLLLTN